MSDTLNNSEVLSNKFTQSGGRFPGLYKYDIVKYKNNEYAIITIEHKNKEVRFVVDNSNTAKVLTKSWHLSSGKYIATHYTMTDGKSKEVYLHNFIRDNCTNEGDKIVIHINNNMLDNRLENLRFVEASGYVPSRMNRARKITLPPDSGFTVDDIPKYISFMKASGEHGDRFAIEIPKLNLFMKLSSSKKVLLKDKFLEAKEKLNEIYKTYPHANPQIDDDLKKDLNESLEYILQSI
jgi:hypothetical protein